MPTYLAADNISVAARQSLIKAFPCFAALTPAQSAELAAHMQEVEYEPLEEVTKEHELIDSIYIIVRGEAEAVRATQFNNKTVLAPIAVLCPGEGIGLHDTGFYSSTGKRTATVTAITTLFLLRLDIKDLYAFLHKYNLEFSMRAASLQMLRMGFIKQSLPFARLSHERLHWLAERVEEVSYKQGDLIFKQGEPGDKCYLVRAGTIEIYVLENNMERQLAVLTPPALFGEATLITHTVRNATARAQTDCELLVLSHAHLTELLESEQNVAQMFMTLMVDRSLPTQNPRVSVHHRTALDGMEITILKNTDNGNYFRLSNEGAFVWEQLDGKHTLQDITLDLANEHNVFAPDMVAALIAKLSRTGFVDNVQSDADLPSTNLPKWQRVLISLKKVFDVRFASGDADAWLTGLYQKYIRYFFTPAAHVILAVIAITGFSIFISETNTILHYFSHKHASLWLVLGLVPLSVVAVILHELGHAFAVKSFGREVHYMGVGWYGLSPFAFTDTSDMWLSPRRPRMWVNITGVGVDVVIAGICALLILIVSQPSLQAMLWLFALYVYIRSFRKLSPLQNADGYYVLMDWVEKNHLRRDAVLWLKLLPASLRQPHLFREHVPEIIYWLACMVYLILITLLTLILQSFVFTIFGIQVNTYLSLILPFLVLLFSSLGIVVEIKQQKL